LYPDDYDHYKAESAKEFSSVGFGCPVPNVVHLVQPEYGIRSQNRQTACGRQKLKWFRIKSSGRPFPTRLTRESIVKAIYSGRGQPNYGFETTANPRWQNTNVMRYPHDMDKARAMLAEIGIKRPRR